MMVEDGQNTLKKNLVVKRAVINNIDLHKALKSLAKEKLPFGTSFNIKRLIAFIERELEKGQETVKKIIDSHCNLDAEGKYILDENGSFSFKNEEEFKKEYDSFLNSEVTFPCDKISTSILESNNVKISANDLAVLEPFLG